MQLMNVPVDDLKAIIDSFELELLPIQIARLVSEDYGEKNSLGKKLMPAVRPSKLLAVDNTAHDLVRQTMSIPLEPLQVNIVEEDEEG